MLDVTYCIRPLPVDRRLPGGRLVVPETLVAAGHRVEVVPETEIEPRPGGVLWLQGNPSWFPRLLRRLVGTPLEARPFTVAWHSEPLPPPAVSGLPRPRLDLRELAKIALRDPRATDPYSNLAALERLAARGLPDLLVVSARARRTTLTERGIDAAWVPFGYHESHGRPLGLERHIDVLMLGARTVARRNRQLRRLRRRGIEVEVRGSWSDPSCWGEGRTELLNRTKIMLSIPRYPGEQSHLRLLMGGANGALVISEPMYDAAPFEPGRHYVGVPAEEMADAIRHYLADDAERRAIVEANARFVTEELTIERSAARVVELVTGHPRWRGGHSEPSRPPTRKL